MAENPSTTNPSTPLVERLRDCAMNHARGAWAWPEEKADAATGGLLDEAADLIDALVEACRGALVQAEGCFRNHYPGDDPSQAAEPEHIAMLRKAIAKAEGR